MKLGTHIRMSDGRVEGRRHREVFLPDGSDIEAEIARLTIAIDQHHFGASRHDKPFCSCGWIGKPSDNWLTAERQFGQHLATAITIDRVAALSPEPKP
jgi:hypothetical protein